MVDTFDYFDATIIASGSCVGDCFDSVRGIGCGGTRLRIRLHIFFKVIAFSLLKFRVWLPTFSVATAIAIFIGIAIGASRVVVHMGFNVTTVAVQSEVSTTKMHKIGIVIMGGTFGSAVFAGVTTRILAAPSVCVAMFAQA